MNLTIEQQRVLRLAEKLLRLANGTSSDAEAESALLKAHTLLSEYDLEITDIGSYKKEQKCSERGAILKGKQVPQWAIILTNTLCTIYSSKSLLMECDDGRSKIVFMGVEPQASIALHSFVLVYRHLETRKYPTGTKATTRASYNMGFVMGLRDKLIAQWEKAREQTANTQALVPVRSAIVKAYVAEKYPRTKKITHKGRIHDVDAYARGKEDGNNYSITPGVSRGTAVRAAVTA